MRKRPAMLKIKHLPREILVYVCDTLDDGTPVYAVAMDVDGIPEDSDGDTIGIYTINRRTQFRVRRELD